MNATATKVIALPEQAVSLLDAYLRGLRSDATRRVYGQVLRAFGDFIGEIDLTQVTRRQVEAYRSHLEALGRSPSTISKYLSALCGLFDFAVEEGLMSRNPVSAARRPKLSDVSPRRAPSQDEVRRILAVPKSRDSDRAP